MIFKDYRESSGNGDGEGGDWEDMKANVEWAVGVVRNLREEGGGDGIRITLWVRYSYDRWICVSIYKCRFRSWHQTDNLPKANVFLDDQMHTSCGKLGKHAIDKQQ